MELVNKAKKRRKRQLRREEKNKYAKTEEADTTQPKEKVVLASTVVVPMPAVDPRRRGWFRKYDFKNIVSVDVEKVINYYYIKLKCF